MADLDAWTPAPENTLESLRHALQMFDGIEFDIRITADHQLILHHDRTVSVPAPYLKGKPSWLEEWTHDELVDLGFLSFEAFLDEPMRAAWGASRSSDLIQKQNQGVVFLDENTTTNTSPKPCDWQRRRSTSEKYLVKTPCFMRFIEACPPPLNYQPQNDRGLP
jgi:glycerophosphoryl diester phosphodiesterase